MTERQGDEFTRGVRWALAIDLSARKAVLATPDYSHALIFSWTNGTSVVDFGTAYIVLTGDCKGTELIWVVSVEQILAALSKHGAHSNS